jgi:glycoprotein endo-alpha-1,2-mannosidase
LEHHGTHPALYRLRRRPSSNNDNDNDSTLLPVLYVYDQYRIPAKEWKPLFAGTNRFPAIVLALIVESNHWNDYVGKANFDGGYTYFASNTFTYGSNPRHWKQLQDRAIADGKWFIPSVGPGYDDERVRPWNGANTKQRTSTEGSYYDTEWEAAIASKSNMISITSFNEWHEGTQIEPAIPKTTFTGTSYTYKDYEGGAGGGPNAYLDRTKQWVERFQQQRIP